MKERLPPEYIPVALPTACVFGSAMFALAFSLGVVGWLAVIWGVACAIGSHIAIRRFGAWLRAGESEPRK